MDMQLLENGKWVIEDLPLRAGKEQGTLGAGRGGEGAALLSRGEQSNLIIYLRRICQKNLSPRSYAELPASRPPSPEIMWAETIPLGEEVSSSSVGSQF